EEIFYNLRWATLQYLFLKRCAEAGDRLRHAMINDDWVIGTLAGLGYQATTQKRRNLLDALEMYGLCTAFEQDRRRQLIASPVLYQVIKKTEESVPSLLNRLRADVAREARIWGLEPVQPSVQPEGVQT